jgi:hypothetical protein
MERTTEDRVRGRAHSIWEAEGRPEGRDRDHWLQAERELSEPVDGPVDAMPEAAAGMHETVDARLAMLAEPAPDPVDGPPPERETP